MSPGRRAIPEGDPYRSAPPKPRLAPRAPWWRVVFAFMFLGLGFRLGERCLRRKFWQRRRALELRAMLAYAEDREERQRLFESRERMRGLDAEIEKRLLSLEQRHARNPLSPPPPVEDLE